MKRKTNKIIVVLSVTVVILLVFVIIQNTTNFLEQSAFKKTSEYTGTLANDTVGQATGSVGEAAEQTNENTSEKSALQVNAEANATVSTETSTQTTASVEPSAQASALAETSAGTKASEDASESLKKAADTAKNAEVSEEQAENDVWSLMHKMANTKIVAEEIWGRIQINEDSIKKVFDMVEKSDFSDKAKLLEIIDNWKKEDFSKAVEEHNYLWEKLGGTVGKATGLAK